MTMEQPKRAVSAYWIWLGENRESLQKELPGKRGSEVSKLAGTRWKALSDAERKPYEDRAEQAKAEYAKHIQEFKDQGGVVEKRKAKASADGGKKAKDENAPKRPAGGAYGCFLADKREEIKNSLPADHKMTDVGKKAGELWRDISASEKEKYEEIYAKKSEEYKAAMEEYRKSGGEAGEEEQGTGSPKRKATSPAGPAAKRGKAKATAAPEATVEIDANILSAATKLGDNYERTLKSLMAHPDVKAAGKSAEDALAAVKTSKGLFHPARRALLGA